MQFVLWLSQPQGSAQLCSAMCICWDRHLSPCRSAARATLSACKLTWRSRLLAACLVENNSPAPVWTGCSVPPTLSRWQVWAWTAARYLRMAGDQLCWFLTCVSWCRCCSCGLALTCQVQALQALQRALLTPIRWQRALTIHHGQLAAASSSIESCW